MRFSRNLWPAPARRTLGPLGVLLALVLAVSGCAALNAENIPVRTGVEDGYRVTVFFPDALNLADGAQVKIDGARVGVVEDITTENFKARVDMSIDGDTRLPKGTVFRLRPTTALGELFVDIIRGDGKQEIKPGSVIDASHTRSAPTVEDALASASLLINGGSLSQIKTIVGEVNTSLEGRTGTVRDFLENSNRLVSTLNDSRTDLDGLFRAIAKTSAMLNAREAKINRAIKMTAPVSKLLARNSPKVTKLLSELNGMSKRVDRLVTRTRGDLEYTVAELGPVVDTLQGNKALAKSMLLKTIDLSKKLDRAVPTDYLNLMLVFRLSGNLGLLGGADTAAEGAR